MNSFQHKSPGQNKITAEQIKAFDETNKPYLRRFLNKCYRDKALCIHEHVSRGSSYNI